MRKTGRGWMQVLALAGFLSRVLAAPGSAPSAPQELPRPDLLKNVFILIITRSDTPRTTYDDEVRDVFARLAPPRKLYARLWFDGDCSQPLQKEFDSYRPCWMNSPLDDQNAAYRSKDRRMRQWALQDNRIVTQEEKKGGNPADADLTPSGYAREAYDGMLEMARRVAKGYLADKERGKRVLFVAGPNEFEYVFFNRDKFIPDYSPFAVAEFRDWLTWRGEFAPGGRFEGLGRKDGEPFSDDPSPAKAKGKNRPFNDVYQTKFTTWKLLYWDLDDFPDPLAMDAPGMPAPGERGHTPGGFDAPRALDQPLWKAWQCRDPAGPGYRQWRIYQSLVEMYREMNVLGVPREEIWSRMRGMFSPTLDFWKGRRDPVMAHWVAVTPYSMAGFNIYGWRVLKRQEETRLAGEEARKAGVQLGTFEWHPDIGPNPKLDEGECLADLAGFHRNGFRIIGIRHWLCMGGGHGIAGGAMRIRGTPLEGAIRRFLVDVPDVPFGEPADAVYLPPRVRGLSLSGEMLTWKDELWDGLDFRYGAWKDFAGFEVGACEALDAQGLPRSPSVVGKTAEARLGIPPEKMPRYLVVRALAKDKKDKKGKTRPGPWSEPLEKVPD